MGVEMWPENCRSLYMHIWNFGMLYEITSDQGTQFESELFKVVCELLGIDKTRTTGYHPSSNG